MMGHVKVGLESGRRHPLMLKLVGSSLMKNYMFAQSWSTSSQNTTYKGETGGLVAQESARHQLEQVIKINISNGRKE